jgi:hypothetical protein
VRHCGMSRDVQRNGGSWRSGVAEFFRQWRVAREERRRVRDVQRDRDAAEELKRGEIDRFPHGGGL